MALFKLDAGRGARAVRVEVAPAMCGFLDPWLAERALTPFEQGSAEQVLVSTAGAVTSHRDEGRHLCGVIGSESSMASLLQPLLDPDGDLLGWVYLEFEHHLIPDASRRAELAEAALRELEGERSRSGPSLSPSAHGPITRAFA